MDLSIFLALGSNLLFTASSLGFRHLSRRITPLWMNTVKTLVATSAFAISTLLTSGFQNFPSLGQGLGVPVLLLSGFLGLGLGDTLLLRTMTEIGSARALILFSFHPIWTGSFAYLFLGQSLGWPQMLAVICLMGVLYALASERGADGARHARLSVLGLGLLAVTLDAIGVLLTRLAFDRTPGLGLFEANVVRGVGALMAFATLAPWMKPRLRAGWQKLSARERGLALGVSLTGSFLSLTLWLAALRIGTLAVISAIAGAGPLFATLLECGLERRAPSKGLLWALAFFAVGFLLLQLHAIGT